MTDRKHTPESPPPLPIRARPGKAVHLTASPSQEGNAVPPSHHGARKRDLATPFVEMTQADPEEDSLASD